MRANIHLRRATLGIWLALGVLLFVLILRSVDAGNLARSLSATNPWFILLALLSVAGTVLAKALRWRLLFYPDHETLGLSALASALLIGQTINILLPARLGELGRAYLIGEAEERRKLLALGTIVVEKLLDGLALLSVLALVIVFLPVHNSLRVSGALGALMTAVLLALVVLLTGHRERLLRAADNLGRRMPLLARVQPDKHLASLADGLDSVQSPSVRARLVIWTVCIWSLAAATNLLVLVGMQTQVPVVLASVLVLAVVHLGLVVPSPPGRIGVFHYLALLSLSMLGVEQAQALAYGIVLHFVVILPIVVAGLVCLWKENVSLFRLVEETRRQ
jgi:uncharacterized protein (TIRG00374 family)